MGLFRLDIMTDQLIDYLLTHVFIWNSDRSGLEEDVI